MMSDRNCISEKVTRRRVSDNVPISKVVTHKETLDKVRQGASAETTPTGYQNKNEGSNNTIITE